MGRRYSDIKRAANLKAALDNYTAYLATPRTPKVGLGKALTERVALQVESFGGGGGGAAISVRGAKAGFDRLGTTINASSGAKVAAAASGAKFVRGFKAAMVITFENSARSAKSKDSAITKQPYLKYEGERFACPFGAKTATDKEIEAGAELISAMKQRTGLIINRVSITPERMSYGG